MANLKKSEQNMLVKLGKLDPDTTDENLIKAMKKEGLVQKEVSVKRGGKVFMRKQWVRASDNKGKDYSQQEKQGQKKQEKQPNKSKSSFSFETFQSLKNDKEKALQYLKDSGITWKEDKHPGINWMRASMSAKKVVQGGAAEVIKPNETKEKLSKRIPVSNEKQIISALDRSKTKYELAERGILIQAKDKKDLIAKINRGLKQESGLYGYKMVSVQNSYFGGEYGLRETFAGKQTGGSAGEFNIQETKDGFLLTTPGGMGFRGQD